MVVPLSLSMVVTVCSPARAWLSSCWAYRSMHGKQASVSREQESLDASREQQAVWKRQHEQSLRHATNLAGDSLLAAACIVYFQRIPVHAWEELVATWSSKLLSMGLPVSEWFSLGEFMLSSETVRSLLGYHLCSMWADVVAFVLLLCVYVSSCTSTRRLACPAIEARWTQWH